MLYFIRFIFGFVRIAIISENPEILLSKIIGSGISVWSVERKGINIYLNVSFKNYKQIRNIRKNITVKTKVKIIKKYGFPIWVKSFFKRIGVVLGICLVLIINIFMSNFIWIVDVTGIELVDKKEIIRVCNELNIKEGIYSKKIDVYDAAQRIAQQFNEIAWISLNIEGSKLTVNISEASNSDKDISPTNIIALEDGVIKTVNYISGSKCVEPGQTVRKGEVLISGVETVGDKTKFVVSNGEVLAQTQREFKTQIKKSFIYEKIKDNKTRCVLEIFGIKIPLYLCGINNSNNSFTDKQSISIFGENIPIGLYKREFLISEESEIKLNDENAKNIAISLFEKEIRKYKIKELLRYDLTIRSDSKYYYCKFNAVCIENIGESKNIQTSNY